MAFVPEILAVAVRPIGAFAKVYYLVFAILSIVGGLMGYLKTKSVVSVVSGSISGILLVIASFMLLERRSVVAGVIGLMVSVLLAGKFVPDYIHKKALFPGGLMAVLSLVGITLSIIVLLPK